MTHFAVDALPFPWVCCDAQETIFAEIDMGDVDRMRQAIPTSVQRRLDLYALKSVGENGGSPPPSA